MRWSLFLLLGLTFAQRILSRTQIEVKGYSVEKVGLPRSPVPAGKGRFAYIEYWAQDKPKPGWYIECLNTQYYTQWSQLLEVPKGGEGRPLRLIGLKEAIVALSYDEDPLTRGAMQEMGKFYDLRGQPITPKWIALSVYDRSPSDAAAEIILSPDSTHFLWYAYQVGKKGEVERGWYALWQQNGRKVLSSTEWSLGGVPLRAVLDARQNLWTVEARPSSRLPLIRYYDLRGRTTREWTFTGDTVLYAPALYVAPQAVYVTGLLPAEKGVSHTEGQVGRWVLGEMRLPLTDTSTWRWTMADIPAEWFSLYKDPTAFTVKAIYPQGDSVVYVLWEDIRVRGSTAIAGDIWIARWRQANNTFVLHWAHRIEKRQREPSPEMVSFFHSLNETFLTIVFLTERTGKGRLRAYLLNHQTGEAITKDIGDNTAGDLLLLPGLATYLTPREVICFALAPPGKNGYQIYHIRL